jgi:hypothetical protein
MKVYIGIASLAFVHYGCDTTSTNAGRFQNNGFARPNDPEIPNGFRNGNGYGAFGPNIPLISPAGSVCDSKDISIYTWGYELYNKTTSPIVDFLGNPKAARYRCGDVYINVADHTATTYIRDEYALVPFIKNVRATGNRGIVFLTYGDVQVSANGAPNGPTEFADTFFRWLNSVSDADMKAILPLGLSYDCEHLPHSTIVNALTRAQELKQKIARERLGGDASQLTVEWTIEGQEKPHDTDTVLKLSDRALMMAYRNHVDTSVRDPGGEDNLVTRVFDFMFTKQCRHCLDDAYAEANYKAKIKIMIEADCECGASCNKISFCAYDAAEELWGRKNHLGQSVYKTGEQYMIGTLQEANERIRARLGPARYERLFGKTENLSLFVVHNWSWFTCFFDDPSVSIPVPIGAKQQSCKNYHSMAKSCRSQ